MIMMKNEKFDFTKISMNGRLAYTIMCAERYAKANYPLKDWRKLFAWLWKATSSFYDEWYYRFMEILPEYLYEFDTYEESNFDYLSKEDYEFYYMLLKDVDNSMKTLIKIPADISMIYSYMPIPGIGEESIKLVYKSIKILEKKKIELPNPSQIAFSSFKEKNGWGKQFDGKKLSIICNNE